MAIYRLSASVISRSSGRSSVAAAAYRAGVDLVNDRDGLSHNYANRNDVIHAEIMLPDHAPERFADRSTLWNAVEASETRKNSQTAREIQLALPHELTEAERIDLVRVFTHEQFVSHGMIADIALHGPGGEGDQRNHHAHIMLTTREVDSDGFTVKNRDWNKKELLEAWRAEWAAIQNRYLEQHALSVDHRTLEAQREDHLRQSAMSLEEGAHEQAAEHTAKAIELDREPRVHLKREDFQTAMLDRDSTQAKLLARSYAAIHSAKERAQEFISGIKEALAQTLSQTLDTAREAWDNFFADADIEKATDKLKNELGIERDVEQHGHSTEHGVTREIGRKDEPEVKHKNDRGIDFGWGM